MATGDAIDRIYGRARVVRTGRVPLHRDRYRVCAGVQRAVVATDSAREFRIVQMASAVTECRSSTRGAACCGRSCCSVWGTCSLASASGSDKIMLPCNSCWDRAWHGILAYLCCRSEMEKNENTRREIVTICKSEFSHLTVDDKRDVHVGLEMVVFEKRRQLHANYIERYNTLWHRVRALLRRRTRGSRRGCERHGKELLDPAKAG